MKKISAFLMTIFVACVAVSGQPHNITPAFKAGEQLNYTVSYSASMWPNTDMGNIVIVISDDNVCGEPTLKISARATVKGMFAWFYNLDDRYFTWLDKDNFRPLKSTAEILEGDYRYSSEFIYDWNKKISKNTFRNHKHDKVDRDTTVVLGKDAMDGVALFFNLRLHAPEDYTQGEYMLLPLLLKDKVQLVKYKYHGRDTIKVQGLGNVKTLKFSCQLINDDAASFEDGSEFFLWISDDSNKIPVYLESPLRVGKVRVRLSEYNNLMYPNNSVLMKARR